MILGVASFLLFSVSNFLGLSTFFAGPTFADCGNVIMASIYQYILNIIGTTNFNKLL